MQTCKNVYHFVIYARLPLNTNHAYLITLILVALARNLDAAASGPGISLVTITCVSVIPGVFPDRKVFVNPPQVLLSCRVSKTVPRISQPS